MKPDNPHRPGASAMRHSQGGLSLVELMVAITIGMLIVAALLALFLNISRNNSELAKTNAQIESGRFAVQLLENDIVHAGFWGEYVPPFDDLTSTAAPEDISPVTGLLLVPGTPRAVPDPCLGYASWSADPVHISNLIGIPIQAYDAAPAGCAVVANKKGDTDVLVVRHAEPSIGTACGGEVCFQASQCGAEINATPPQHYVLATAGHTLHKKNCAPAVLPIASGDTAVTRKFISNIYYVRNFSVTAGDGIPTLMRSEFAGGVHQAAQPLIEGIEGFRVEVGIDDLSETGAAVDYTAAVNWTDPTNQTTATNRGDGIPDGAYVSCGAGCTAAQLTNAVSVRLHVLARAKEATPGYTDTKTYALGGTNLGPFNDGFKRHVFSTTVRLNNISGRRETP